MASKQKNVHQKLETDLAQGITVHGDLLWDFAFEQIVILTNQLLHAKALPLSQVMHVVHLFAYATETASGKQAFHPDGFGETLVQCATDVILDYCQADHHGVNS
jgi:hypothetical protein